VTLNDPQKEIIAKLPDNPAYALLLDLAKSVIDDVEVRMEGSKNDKEALWHLHTWRALRCVHKILAKHPEQMETDIQDMLDAKMEAAGGVYLPPAFIPSQHRFPFGDPLDTMEPD
jgi:hypothetical protein